MNINFLSCFMHMGIFNLRGKILIAFYPFFSVSAS